MRRLGPAQISGCADCGDDPCVPRLADAMRSTACRFRADELIVTNGAMEALNLCLQAVTQPGDVVVVESPLLRGLAGPGAPAPRPSKSDRSGRGVRLGALETLLQHQKVAACWFMPTFQNPLGHWMPDAKLAGAGAAAGTLRGSADRGRCVCRTALRCAPTLCLPRPLTKRGWCCIAHRFPSLAPGYHVGWAAAGRRQGRGNPENDDLAGLAHPATSWPLPSTWCKADWNGTCAICAMHPNPARIDNFPQGHA